MKECWLPDVRRDDHFNTLTSTTKPAIRSRRLHVLTTMTGTKSLSSRNTIMTRQQAAKIATMVRHRRGSLV